MTRERASEIISNLYGRDKYDMFDFFLKYFYGENPSYEFIKEFSDLCGIVLTTRASL
jgi:hypothetical protein